MAGIKGASLSVVPNIKVGREIRSNNYLTYPIDMQDDGDTLGQDRIMFSLKQYAKKLTSEQIKKINPSSSSTSDAGPFPPISSRLKEEENYKDAFVKLSKSGTYSKVFLPVQDKISDQNAVTWSEGTMNDVQRRLANLSYNLMSNRGNVDTSFKEINDFLASKETGNLARLYMVEQATSLQNIFSRATGSILNPNLELLFEKPSLRPFTFNFKFNARSQGEADRVKLIIKFFKSAMAPRLQPNNLFINAPYVFKINYLLGSKREHSGINKIKVCALNQCNVDYTPNNTYATYKDGTMVSYTVNLTFQELLPVFSNDYEDDHSIGF